MSHYVITGQIADSAGFGFFFFVTSPETYRASTVSQGEWNILLSMGIDIHTHICLCYGL